jgi:hypothetical protein
MCCMDRPGSGCWLARREVHEGWRVRPGRRPITRHIGAMVGGFLSSTLLGVDVTGFNVTSSSSLLSARAS